MNDDDLWNRISEGRYHEVSIQHIEECAHPKEIYIVLMEQFRLAQKIEAILAWTQFLAKIFIALRKNPKASIFMEDTFSLIYRRLLSISQKNENSLRIIQGACDYIKSVVHTTDLLTCTSISEEEIRKRKQLVVALILRIFSFPKVMQPNPCDELKHLVLDLLKNFHTLDIPIDHILITSTWCHTYNLLHQVLCPDNEEKEEEEILELEDIKNEMEKNIFYLMPNEYTKTFIYKHSYVSITKDFYEWEKNDIAYLIIWILLHLSQDILYLLLNENQMDFNYIFMYILPYIEFLLNSNSKQSKINSIHLLSKIIHLIKENSISMDIKSLDVIGVDQYLSNQLCFPHVYHSLFHAFLYHLMWIEEEKWRQMGYHLLEQLFSTISYPYRLSYIQSLVMECPNPNLCGLLIDRFRQEVHQLWKTSYVVFKQSYDCQLDQWIVGLIDKYLKVVLDEEFRTQLDILLAIFSLWRYVMIRDKTHEMKEIWKEEWKQHQQMKLNTLQVNTLEKLKMMSTSSSVAKDWQKLSFLYSSMDSLMDHFIN